MRASRLVVLCVLLAGCGANEEVLPDAAPLAVAPVAAPVPQPPPPPESALVTQGQYYAVFLGDELDRCIERTRRYTIPFGTEWSPRPLPPIDRVPEGRVVALTTDCATSFEGRTVLASCDGSTELESYDDVDAGLGEPPTGVTMIQALATRHYRFETALEDDLRLEECLAMQHRWTAVPDTSVEYARARTHARERARSGAR